jgi:ATP-binding cassette subfamily C protein LapB
MTSAISSSPQLPRLLAALLRLAELQREPVDRLALQEAAQHVQAEDDSAGAGKIQTPAQQITRLTRHLGLKPARWLKAADPSQVPALVHDPIDGWGVLVGQNAQQQWVVLRWDDIKRAWSEGLHDDPTPLHIAKLRLSAPFELGKSPVFALIRTEIAAQKGRLIEAAAGGLIIGILGLITSFYSMQIYDRVIPTGAMQTLMVLSLGALIAIGLDWMARSARTQLYENIIDEVDKRMARTVYLRLLAVRLDQLPRSVGSLASQMRGYESVRSFLTQVTTSVLVDLPFALLFLVIMALTSSVDGNSELQIKQLIHQTLQPQHTLVLVTHKPDMLQLVDRILVVANHQVVMDGPKAQVLARLNANTPTNANATATGAAA